MQHELRHTVDHKYCKKYLNKIDNYKCKDKYYSTQKLFVVILELLYYDSNVFDVTSAKLLSEEDYVVKVWGPLMETLFRGTGIILHWGDTVSRNIKESGHNLRMDLRLMTRLNEEINGSDVGTGEIAKDIWLSKYYKDKLKTVLSSKIDLNYLINASRDIYDDSLPDINVLFVIMEELELSVYVISLAANSLYVLQEVETVLLSKSITDVKNNGISEFVFCLFKLKKLVLNVKDIKARIDECNTVKKRKTMKQLRDNKPKNQNKNLDYRRWVRPVWFPTKYEFDDN